MAEEEKRIEIYQGLEGEVVFDVDAKGETIWATQAQMAQVFGVAPQNITYHIKNIYAEGELEDGPTVAGQNRTCKEILQVQIEGGRRIERKVKVYNLDMIISVGYRVNSKKATQFRIWATKVLKSYVTDGVAVNEKRLAAIAAARDMKRLHDVEDVMGIIRRLTARSELDAGEANGVLEVISKYAGSFKTLEEYDDGHIDLKFLNRKRREKVLTLEMCDAAISQLAFSIKGGELFGKKRGGGFEGGLAAIYQSFDGKELYPSIPEKAANLLYLIIKDHPFYDGNKRIGALLFILFLTLNDYHLTDKGETKISDRALTAIALLIAESEPKEKELIVSLVCKLLE